MLNTLVMLLAGGRGTRLNILGAERAKPAVPFGGLYRIVDFALSNCMHARMRAVGVLTQYRPISLLAHLGDGSHWDMNGKNSRLKNLPPFQASADYDWYHGTADAVFQNLNFLRRHRPKRVLVLSGDHIYRMDYLKMVAYHNSHKAALTIAAMPVPPEETHRFGIIVDDADRNVVEFQEKPLEAHGNLASMGIYVFETEVLIRELEETAGRGGTDFGRDVIPAMLGREKMCVYPFEGYWRDVGTIDSLFSANRDVLLPGSGINLQEWCARTNLEYEGVRSMPPAGILAGAKVVESMVSPGCVVEGTVIRSILSPGVRVGPGARVVDSIVMHRSQIGAGAEVMRSIVDKHCTIGAGAVLAGSVGGEPNRETPDHLAAGLVVVGRNAAIPEGLTVGTNSIVHPNVTADDFTRDVPVGSTVRGLHL
jgi:glucose-1-phosphate adenylyltransferase